MLCRDVSGRGLKQGAVTAADLLEVDGCGRVIVPRTPGWLHQEDQAFRLSPEHSAQFDALTLGTVIRFTSPTSKTTPPRRPADLVRAAAGARF